MDDNLQRKIDALEQNEKKKKSVFRVVVIVLIVIFFAGIGWGVNKVLLTEGTMEMPVVQRELPEVAAKEQAIDLLKSLTDFVFDETNAARVKLSKETSLSIDDDSLKSDSTDESFNKILLYIKDDVLDSLKEDYPSYSEPYGTKISDKICRVVFTPDDLQSFSCVTEEDNEQRVHLNFIFNDVAFPQQPGTVMYDTFDMGECRIVTDSFKNKVADIAEIKSADIACDDFELTAAFDRDTEQLGSLDCIRRYNVTLTALFKGELAALGEKTFSFVFTARESASFTYASLTLSKKEMWLEKGDTDNLEPNRTVEDVTVTWQSSDPEIASVDDEGYIKGHKVSDKPVTITAKFEFLGNTYTDTCEVYVRKPVKEIKLSEKELTLNIGEKHTLSVSVSPEKATFKDVRWFSDDESIATVDENGEITALGAGQAKVFAISLDGNYKSTCELTVE